MTEGKRLMPKNNAQDEVRLDKWYGLLAFTKLEALQDQ